MPHEHTPTHGLVTDDDGSSDDSLLQLHWPIFLFPCASLPHATTNNDLLHSADPPHPAWQWPLPSSGRPISLSLGHSPSGSFHRCTPASTRHVFCGSCYPLAAPMPTLFNTVCACPSSTSGAGGRTCSLASTRLSQSPCSPQVMTPTCTPPRLYPSSIAAHVSQAPRACRSTCGRARPIRSAALATCQLASLCGHRHELGLLLLLATHVSIHGVCAQGGLSVWFATDGLPPCDGLCGRGDLPPDRLPRFLHGCLWLAR